MTTFYEGLAEILEVDTDAVTPELPLASANADWDSLAVVSTIALIDDCYNVMVDGKALVACGTVADIEALIDAARQRNA
ncbi:acyl carrier protein [Scleromatobacter humisilvae]|uniref:Acyl carrier protein n=1 Tax=Scleromatobacter humisilvae TaxID=2897159 RepID=A0A9X2C1I8_9BURK|nr:acyl carrier protein [Scleromatobacter humisilvae]MCK9688337.1 acyl carrier protein [Scleromatobacter humisilvae]